MKFRQSTFSYVMQATQKLECFYWHCIFQQKAWNSCFC